MLLTISLPVLVAGSALNFKKDAVGSGEFKITTNVLADDLTLQGCAAGDHGLCSMADRLSTVESTVAALMNRTSVIENTFCRECGTTPEMGTTAPDAYRTAAPTLDFSTFEQSLTCQHTNDWHYVYEVEDCPSTVDLPTNDNAVAAGFSNPNAYYIGNSALNQIGHIKEAEVCFGKKSTCGFTCMPIKAENVGEALRTDQYSTVICNNRCTAPYMQA